MNKIIKLVISAILLCNITIAAAWIYVDQQVNTAIALEQAEVFRVTPGQSARSVIAKLHNQGLIEGTLGLRVRLKLAPHLANVKVGTYQLKPGMSALDVLVLLHSGKELQYTVQLIEGLRWQDWYQTLLDTPKLSDKAQLSEQAQALLSSTTYGSLEGLLMPDTYAFVEGTPAIDIVQRAYTSMQQYLELQWPQRAIDLPYDNSYEALIMASIVEKETAVPTERPHIAGVFVNRLNLNMRLQTDPTVIYGMGEAFDGDIRRRDLKTPTPYNTYVIKGLPPTPIAMVGKHAIDAALNPLYTEDLYFVAKGDGSHQFSQTLSEHNQAVRTYQLNK